MLPCLARVALEALHPVTRERVLVPPDRDADGEVVVALLANVEVLRGVAEHGARLLAVVARQLGLGLAGALIRLLADSDHRSVGTLVEDDGERLGQHQAGPRLEAGLAHELELLPALGARVLLVELLVMVEQLLQIDAALRGDEGGPLVLLGLVDLEPEPRRVRRQVLQRLRIPFALRLRLRGRARLALTSALVLLLPAAVHRPARHGRRATRLQHLVSATVELPCRRCPPAAPSRRPRRRCG
eukprot:scaffold124511_cov54-Phaeocystis_antarctica.AAC.1